MLYFTGGEFISAVDLDADLVVDLNKWYVMLHRASLFLNLG
jgi:hypothetical protein